MADVFLARQPIFDLDERLVGYELLYRRSPSATAATGTTPLAMSSSTLVTALLAIGLDELTHGTRAFINFPPELLARRAYELLDPNHVTIELLETVACDDDSVAAVQAMRARGFDVALDDFAGGDEYRRLLELAQIVKVDVLGLDRAQVTGLAHRLRPYRARLLAERVENVEMLEFCKSLGFTLFQGYHFRRPELVSRRDLPPSIGAIAQLMNLVADPSATDRELETAFRSDPALSLKLLQIANSAAIGGLGIESIQHAVQLVGRGTLHRWLALLLVHALPVRSDVQREMVFEALERGRMCELLAMRSGAGRSAPAAFLTGLLSRFDAILGIPIPDLLKHVRVATDVEAALLRADGPLTQYLALASLYADGKWEPTIDRATKLGVLDELLDSYKNAGVWARSVLQPS